MLQEERQKASFSKQALSHVIYGGPEGLAAYLKRQAICDNDPVLKFDPSLLHQSREQMMDVMAKRVIRFYSYHDIFPANGSTESVRSHLLTYQSPLTLHGQMFLTTLDNLCDP